MNSTYRATLAEYSRALGREAHVLTRQPDLLWQQLYNRLQWADPPLAGRLSAERERRSRPGARPWIHRYSQLRESEALIRTLTGHTSAVQGCAVSFDGTWIVSVGNYYPGTFKIWDVSTGAERRTFSSRLDYMNGCALSPDGTWIVSANNDHTLKIWDTTTGVERSTLVGHTGPVQGCAVSPDGTWIVSASDDRTLKIWDAATGAERATLTGHNDKVNSCAVSLDGTWIVSASDDHKLNIWDAPAVHSLLPYPVTPVPCGVVR